MKKEVKIGIIGILALVMLFFGINYLKGVRMFHASTYYYVEYTDINGLANSSPVFASGYKVGLVRDIQYNHTNPGHVVVEVEMDQDMRVPKGSRGELVTDMLGTVKMNLILNLQSKEYYQPGDTISGIVNNGLMGVAETVMPKVQQLIPKMDSILHSLNQLLAHPAGLLSDSQKIFRLHLWNASLSILVIVEGITTGLLLSKLQKELLHIDEILLFLGIILFAIPATIASSFLSIMQLL
jgi:hypothetical protein